MTNLDPTTSYVLGIKIENKEHYDRLMEKHNGVGIFDIDFKQTFSGYPDDYPCLVEYYTGDRCPISMMFMTQLKGIIDDGYLVQIYKGERNPG